MSYYDKQSCRWVHDSTTPELDAILGGIAVGIVFAVVLFFNL